jgi:hypothetical protein
MSPLLPQTAIQGNIYRPFARDHAVYLFLRFGKPGAAARRAMREILRPRVISAAEQADLSAEWNGPGAAPAPQERGRTVGILGLTSSGYRQLRLDAFAPANPEIDSNMFHDGLQLSGYLEWNPGRDEWEAGYKEDIHAFLLLCDHSLDRLQATVAAVSNEFSHVGVVVKQECGQRIRSRTGDPSGSLEPFGFRDDKSQGADPDFVIADHRPGTDPAGAAIGCYATFLKVEQDVARFRQLTTRLSNLLSVAPERAEVLSVGRYKDGNPVAGVTSQGSNGDFTFAGAPESVCPYQAHIRLMNHRDGADENRIIRRGIPYGAPEERGPRGMLFLSLQRRLEDFSILMTRARFGMDPLLSRSRDWTWPQTDIPKTGLIDLTGDLGQKWPSGNDSVSFAINDVTVVRGGVFCFIPPLALLEIH